MSLFTKEDTHGLGVKIQMYQILHVSFGDLNLLVICENRRCPAFKVLDSSMLSSQAVVVTFLSESISSDHRPLVVF